jgi:preprotein translocase subunit SecD
MQLRPVEAAGRNLPLTCGGDEPSCTESMLLDDDGITLNGPGDLRYELGALLLTGRDVALASVVEEQMVSYEEQGDSWAINVELTEDATAVFAASTTEAISKPPPLNQIAWIVDGVILASPTVVATIENGTMSLSGLTREKAESLADKFGLDWP